MDDQPTPDPGTPHGELAALARRLRAAAADAGRPDVAARADEIVALLTPPAADPPGRPARRGDTVVRLLDGLGF